MQPGHPLGVHEGPVQNYKFIILVVGTGIFRTIGP